MLLKMKFMHAKMMISKQWAWALMSKLLALSCIYSTWYGYYSHSDNFNILKEIFFYDS